MTRRLALLSLTVLAACGSSAKTSSPPAGTAPSAAAGPLAVVATTTQVQDFVKEVGGDRVSLTGLLKPNVDPHDYEASPADVQAIGRAGLLVESGAGLEKEWLDPAVSSAGFKGTVVDTSADVKIREGNGTDEEKAGDPHIWQDPTNAILMVKTITAALDKAAPADAAGFDQRSAAYIATLTALDASVKASIATLPADQRKIVTDHDAFGYYLDHYGLEFVGSVLPGFDTQAQLTGKDLADLVAKIKATGTKAVFSESSVPAKTAAAIGQEAGVTVIGGEDALFGDTLGPAGSDGATYVESVKHNTKIIVEALGGTTAP